MPINRCGADMRSVEAPTELLTTAELMLVRVDPQPVNARADFMRGDGDQFWPMELELIEPSLYLRTDAAASARFAAAFDGHVRARLGPSG